MRGGGGGGPLAAVGLLLLGLAGTAAAREEPAPSVRIGRSYTSARALRQPATFVFVAEDQEPILTTLAFGLLYDGPLDARGGFEAGLRVSAGSGRPRPKRIFGALTRGWRRWGGWIATAAGEYQADGGFDVQEGVLAFELTPVGGLPGLGAPVHQRSFPLAWRPWLGAGTGNVFTVRDPDSDREEGSFLRGQARIELRWTGGGAEAGLEGTWWVMEGASPAGYLTASLSVPVTGGLALVASGEAGRQPPRFLDTRHLGLGLGFRR